LRKLKKSFCRFNLYLSPINQSIIVGTLETKSLLLALQKGIPRFAEEGDVVDYVELLDWSRFRARRKGLGVYIVDLLFK
jgi:hypothetical protein